ncbi:hypothetical protein M3148_17635, partial [Georgenia satyanarayanai]|uniref:hypothetical protein n=1 Tax=Georgenia satyanarayanai TaxID=860221 RepID=UPI002040BF41
MTAYVYNDTLTVLPIHHSAGLHSVSVPSWASLRGLLEVFDHLEQVPPEGRMKKCDREIMEILEA